MSITQNNELKVGVYDEWSRLKSVMLGNVEDSVFPKFQKDWGRYSNLKEFIDEGKRWIDRDPESGRKMIEQMNKFEELLKNNDVTVYRPDKIPKHVRENSLLGDGLLYARDPHLVIGTNIIQTNMRMIYRNKEHLGWKNLFMKLSETNKDVRWVNMPDMELLPSGNTPEEWRNDRRLFVEGGDTFIIGKDILVGFSSLGSSLTGINWLQQILSDYGYKVHPIHLNDDWLHLDCMCAVLKEGLGVAYLDGFKNGIPEVFKDWEFIEASLEECHAMGSNTLCLEPGVVFIGAQHKRIIKEIEKKGCTPIPVEYDAVEYHGGGIRCTTHPIYREHN
ncbi:MAG TPA: arginine deiminase family protein [Victivallales bacterium]|nr:arginine deiminase family protein [Victivallales bacterium]